MLVSAARKALMAVVWSILVTGSVSLAEEEKQKTVFYTIGYRVWYSSTSRLPTATGIEMEQSGYSVLSGPVGSVTYGNWGLSAGYLFGSLDFNGIVDFAGDRIADPISMGSDREDLDLALSYRATSFLRPFIGFKYVHVSVAERIETPAGELRGSADITLSGPTIGLNLLFRPFKDDQFFLTGTFFYGYGPLRVDHEAGLAGGPAPLRGSDSENTYALNWDVAVGCRLNKSLMASAGYKSQYIPQTRINNGQSQEISGFTLAVILAF